MHASLVRLALLRVARASRQSLALALATGFAASAFTILISNSSSEQLQLSAQSGPAARGAYDILVTPRAAGGPLAPNFNAGQAGGITLAQYHTVAGLPGVQVAAPVALIGQVLQTVDVTVDVTRMLTPAQRQLLVASVTRVSDQGLSKAVNPAAGYTYVTASPLRRSGQDGAAVTREVTAGGSPVPVCESPAATTPRARAAAQLSHPGTCLSTGGGLPPGHVGLVIPWTFPSVLAAVDPDAEARLAGLSRAVTEGRYLSESATSPAGQIPVLAANQNTDDDTDLVAVRALTSAAAQGLASALATGSQPGRIAGLASGAPVVARTTITASDAYAALLAGELNHSVTTTVSAYFSAGPVSYAPGPGGTLQVRQVPGAWAAATADLTAGADPAPDLPDATDTGVRTVTAHVAAGSPPPRLVAVGAYAQARPAAAMSTSVLPLEVYRVAPLFGADDASARALSGSQLLPDANPAGYLTAPPTLLTSLAYLPELTSPAAFSGGDGAAPVTTIRVRVAGAAGGGALARQRITAVADLIRERTGLGVSVTSGASTLTRTVALPAGRNGRPALLLASTWVRPAASALAMQVDEGGLALFALVLAVCAIFVASSSIASLAARRPELELLYQAGWRRRRVAGLLLTEMAAIALAAGLLALAVTMPAGAVLGLRVSAGQAAASLPVAVLLAAAGIAVPAWRACRPARLRGDAPRRAVRGMRLSSGGIRALAARNLLRAPSRNSLAFAAVVLASAAVAGLAVAEAAFGGSLTGEVAGQVLTWQPGAADFTAGAGTLVLLAMVMTDLARLAVTGRRPELELLRELGWDHRDRDRLVRGEMLLIAGAGATLGAALAALALTAAAGSAPWPLWPAAAGGGLLTLAVAGLAAALPVRLHRDPVTRAYR